MSSDWNPVRRTILKGRRFVVTSHVHPDGDAVGSVVAFTRLLRRMGRDARPVLPSPVPPAYHFLDPRGSIRVYEDGDDRLLSGADALFILDASTNDRLGALDAASKRLGLRRVCIDHHPGNSIDADLKRVRPDACSTAQLIYELALELGCPIDRRMAEAIYTGLHTDTVSFNFLGTNARTHEIAADLLRRGVDPKRIWMRIYGNDPPGLVKLAGLALGGLRTGDGGRLAWITVRMRDWRRFGVCHCESEAFTRFLLTIRGVGVIAVFCEESRSRVRVSLRALDRTDVGRAARTIGGGGHRTSAGATIEAPLGKAVRTVIGMLSGGRSRTIP